MKMWKITDIFYLICAYIKVRKSIVHIKKTERHSDKIFIFLNS